MADKNPNQLPSASTLQDTDTIIVQQGTTNKATLLQLKSYMPGSSEPSGQVKSFKVDYSAVGDGTTDDTTAVSTALAANQRIFDNGDFLTTGLVNKYGCDIQGGARILKQTANLKQQLNTSADKHQRVFGEEHLSAFWKRIKAGLSCLARMDGDSTTSGTGGTVTPDVLLANLTNKYKVPGITYSNGGAGGHSTTEWLSTHLAASLALNPNVYIIRWGINDSKNLTPAQYIDNLDTGLALIRGNASFTVDKLSIILQSASTTLDDNQDHKGQIWNEAVDAGLRALARKYQCCFMDIYGKFQDSLNSGDFINTDGLHPQDVFYEMIMTYTFSVLIPEQYRVVGGVFDRGTGSFITPTSLHTAYNLGLNYDYVGTGDGWPATGELVTNKTYNGTNYILSQTLYPFNKIGTFTRQSVDSTFSVFVANNIDFGNTGSTSDAPSTYPYGTSFKFVSTDFPINGYLETIKFLPGFSGMTRQILTSYDGSAAMYVRGALSGTWQAWKQVTLT